MYAHSRAPVRIGIAGGGTDLPVWTRSGRVGRCLSLSIASYTHAAAITRPDGQVVASYRQRDEASSATEIANGLIRESALLHGWEDGFEVHTLSELSSRGSGLGVSSSIAVALAACFRRMSAARDGRNLDPRWQDGGVAVFQENVARDAWAVEIDRLHRPIGRQDHVAATYGGLRVYRFEGVTGFVEKSFTNEDALWLARHLALVELPAGHDSRSILSMAKKVEMLQASADALPIAVNAVEKHSAKYLGEALVRCQASKAAIPGAVPPWLDELVKDVNTTRGVIGCKVAGAGGGGHIVFAHDDADEVLERVSSKTGLRVMRVEPDLEGVKSEVWP